MILWIQLLQKQKIKEKKIIAFEKEYNAAKAVTIMEQIKGMNEAQLMNLAITGKIYKREQRQRSAEVALHRNKNKLAAKSRVKNRGRK